MTQKDCCDTRDSRLLLSPLSREHIHVALRGPSSQAPSSRMVIQKCATPCMKLLYAHCLIYRYPASPQGGHYHCLHVTNEGAEAQRRLSNLHEVTQVGSGRIGTPGHQAPGVHFHRDRWLHSEAPWRVLWALHVRFLSFFFFIWLH